jgi:sialidase-1
MPLDYDRNEKPDTGYTGWVQFEDGEIYVVNYIKDDASKAQIRGYSFYPNDIIL